MHALTHATICPRIFTKLFWMRVNRTLAWTLLLSPVLQWAAGVNFWTGLWIDLAILAAHGALSLTLFGAPAGKARKLIGTMHLMGFKEPGLSERNRYLLSGYRIALAIGALALLSLPVDGVGILVCGLLFYPILRLPITILQHIWCSVTYAMRRWGWRNWPKAATLIIVIMYVAFSLSNLAR